ncbi:MAG: hypothetical protein IJ064_05750 [Bacteroidaceae bacterium]|nr:hypothetical protein [Bacteroidaceae bacterium]
MKKKVKEHVSPDGRGAFVHPRGVLALAFTACQFFFDMAVNHPEQII